MIGQFLIHEKPLRTGAMAQFKYDEVLEERLKFFSKFGDEVSMSFRDGGLLYVPRRLAPIGTYDDRVLNSIPAINCKKPPRTQEQGLCIAKSTQLLLDGIDHVLEAPTGWGKTYAGSAIAANLGQTTLIVVTKNDLMGEWKKTLVNLIGVPLDKIGHIQQDVCDYEGKWFVLAMVHSLIIENKYPPEMLKYFGTVVFDETHKMAADSFMRAAQMFPAKFRIGLSATPKRSDGKDPVIQANIGEVLVKGVEVPMSPKVLVKKTGWSIPKYKKWNPEKKEWKMVTIPYAPGRMAGVYKRMAADESRNKQIVEFVAQSFAAGRRTVLMTDTREHLDTLFLLLGANGVPGDKMGYYVGGMKSEALISSAAKPVVLCTYAMTNEGTNYPDWDTLVLCTPRAKIKQAIGRVMRKKDGKKTPIVLDLVDVDSIFSSFYKAREVEYYSVKATIVKV